MYNEILLALELSPRQEAVKKIFWELLGFEPDTDGDLLPGMFASAGGVTPREVSVCGALDRFLLLKVVYDSRERMQERTLSETCHRAEDGLGPCLVLATEPVLHHWTLAFRPLGGGPTQVLPLFHRPSETARRLAQLATTLDLTVGLSPIETAEAVGVDACWADGEQLLREWLKVADPTHISAEAAWFDFMRRFELFTTEGEHRAFDQLAALWPWQERGGDLVPRSRLALELFDECVFRNLRLVAWLAYRYRDMLGQSNSLVDLLQEGTVGLMKAVSRFDPCRGCRFSTFAYHWVRQSITRYSADTLATVRIPVHMREALRKRRKRLRSFSMRHGRMPSPAEELQDPDLAATADVHLFLIRQEPLQHSFLDVGVQRNGPTLEVCSAVDGREAVEQRLIRAELDAPLEGLSERECVVLRSRLGWAGGEPSTLEQVGATLGRTRERVRQIEAKAMERLRNPVVRRTLAQRLGMPSL